ncbi:MAG: TonB-dependent receptor, partial [Glaciecola sp.]
MHYTYLCTSTSLVKRAIVMSLAATFLSSQASANASLAATTADIETIEVLGQINSLMIESEIDLTASSSPDLRAQLTQLPSVSINSNGPVTGIVQYRGLYSDRVQVSVDNQLIAGAGPNSMDSPLSHVIGNVSQQVSLYQGIAPVSAGAETIGGAMDISEAMPFYTSSHAYEVNGALNLGHFSNNSDNVSAIVQAVNQSQYIALSADSQSGDSLKAGNGITIPNTFYDRSAMKVRAGIQHNKHRVYVSVSSRNTDESGTPTLAMDIIFIDALVSSLNYQYQLSNTWQLKTSLAANNNEHDMNNFALRENNNPMSHRLNSVFSQGRSIGFGALQTSNEWVNEYGIEARTRTQNSRITNPNMAAFYLHNYRDVTRDIASVFGQWQRNISGDTGLNNYQLGLRLSEVRASANNIDSNMAMMSPAVRSLRDAFNDADKDLDFSLIDMVAKSSFTLNDSLQMQLSAGIKEKAPGYFQLYSWFPLGISAGLADGRNYLGNLSLEKETAHKLDLGFVMKGKNWRFMPNIFYT